MSDEQTEISKKEDDWALQEASDRSSWTPYRPNRPNLLQRLRRRAFSICLVLFVVGFGALLYYAFQSSQSSLTGATEHSVESATLPQATSQNPREPGMGGSSNLSSTEESTSGAGAVDGARPDGEGDEEIQDITTSSRQEENSDLEGRSDALGEADDTGVLQLTSNPPATPVVLNGKWVGTTPLSIDSLMAGTHDLVFARSGYETVKRQITLEAGTRRSLHVSLEAEPGHLRVLVRPWGSIFIDGQLRARDFDVWYDTTLVSGTYEVSARHPVLGQRVRTVEIAPGEEQSVVLNMRE